MSLLKLQDKEIQNILEEELLQKENINSKNDLRIDASDLECFHYILTNYWNEVIDESSLSLNHDQLRTHLNTSNISKYHELITNIKRNVIFNKK